MTNPAPERFALGIDLGSASLGWALIRLNDDGSPTGVLDAGVRIFDPGVAGSALDITKGKDKSRAVDRRTARLQRRQLRRRSGRQRELYKLLQKVGLLPPPAADEPDASLNRLKLFDDLDARIRAKWESRLDGAEKQKVHQILPYILRKAALDQPLEPHELGRILYHLSQRRGFLSNRRETKPKDAAKDEKSEVKKAISDLARAMEASHARTLGEYFAGLDPHARSGPANRNIRTRWTARSMYKDEFEKIWAAQQPHHPSLLTSQLKEKIAHLLFFQRPLMDMSHRVGQCELIPEKKRAPWASWEAQRFRLIQRVNDMTFKEDGRERNLSPEQRQIILTTLENDGDQTFAELRKLAGLPRGVRFNLEAGGEKKLPGNRVTAAMRAAFGTRWDDFPTERRTQIIRAWGASESEDELANWAQSQSLLDDAQARQWASLQPQDGYCSLSEDAIRALLPDMELGASYQTAARKIFPERFKATEPQPFIPIVRQAVPELRNPAVERSLTELRKVTNAIIRRYGKPWEIRIELARDLKKPRKQREDAWKLNRARQDERERIKGRILAECGLPHPSREDVDKALLHEECAGICPYTGSSIPFASLFDNPQFEIEHILPFSRCPDDSLANKTLCHIDVNRNVKRNRTPWEAFGSSDPAAYEGIIERVKKFKNPGKLRRFLVQSNEELADFTSRQLNDTRYSSKLAARLLGTLYGGREVERERGAGWESGDGGANRRVIHSSSGMVTATLRKAWCLESILAEPDPSSNGRNRGKARTDHRHHAIDAIVIALTTDSTIQSMNRAASIAPEWIYGPRRLRRLEGPWPNFVDSIRPRIDAMVASHRPEHKLTGQLHDQTLYGKPREDANQRTFIHQRRRVQSLTAEAIENIADPIVREAVRNRLQQLGGNPKLFETEENLPFLIARDGRKTPIRNVRVRETCNTTPIGQSPRMRFVKPANIHHVELFVRRDLRRREFWDSIVVSLLEAMDRKRKGKPVVARVHPDDPEAQFLFSLMKDDTLELNHAGQRTIFRVKKFASAKPLSFVPVNNAQQNEDQRNDKNILRKRPDPLRALAPRKVAVSLLGQPHPAND